MILHQRASNPFNKLFKKHFPRKTSNRWLLTEDAAGGGDMYSDVPDGNDDTRYSVNMYDRHYTQRTSPRSSTSHPSLAASCRLRLPRAPALRQDALLTGL